MSVGHIEAIVAGGSAGSVEALSAILPALPASFSIPMAIVLHVLPTRPSGLTSALARRCALPLREALDKEPFGPGAIYFAPANYHLLVEKGASFALSVDPPVHYSRPAIDVLFESAAEAFGRGLLGVLLTGANEDGAAGMARIKEAGGMTVVQTPETAQAPTMPRAALRHGKHDHVLPLTDIGPFLARLDAAQAAARATKEGR